MKTGPVFRYIRTGLGGGRPIGCLCAVNGPDGIKYGWSLCNPADQFVKSTARKIALQRITNPPKKEIVPAKIKITVFDGRGFHTAKIDVVGKALENFKKDCENRVFAPEPKRPDATTLPDGLIMKDGNIVEEATGQIIARVRD